MTQVHGHRGSRGTHPENTFPSFEEAVDAGADSIEIDVLLTKDDVPIVFHDWQVSHKLCRHANGELVTDPWPVRSLTLEQIEAFDCGTVFQSNFPDQALAPAKVPTLDSFLTWLAPKPIKLNLELKVPQDFGYLNPEPDLFISKIKEVLGKHSLKERVLLQSRDFKVVRCAQEQLDNVLVAYQTWTDTHFPDTAQSLGFKAMTIYDQLATKERIESCHKKGIEVYVFTINEAPKWKSLIEMKVDGIITDFPRKLRAFMQ